MLKRNPDEKVSRRCGDKFVENDCDGEEEGREEREKYRLTMCDKC